MIKYILLKIKSKNIKVHNFEITTNGTVLSQQQIDLINEMEKISTLNIRFSFDKFHEIEKERKGLTKNLKLICRLLKNLDILMMMHLFQ